MVIGTCRITLHLPYNHSLKEKRHIVKSIIDKVRWRFNVSIAEIGHQDKWQLVTFGLATISSSSKVVNQVISSVISFIEDSKDDIQLVDYEIETL